MLSSQMMVSPHEKTLIEAHRAALKEADEQRQQRISYSTQETQHELNELYQDIVELGMSYPDIPELRELMSRLYRLLY